MRVDVRSMTHLSSVSERTAVEDRRRRLEKRIKTFHKQGDTFLGVTELDDLLPQDDDNIWLGVDEWDNEETEENEEGEVEEEEVDREGEWERGISGDAIGVEESDSSRPEQVSLILPSSLGKGRVVSLGLQKLALQEMELRQGQANDSLAALRIELGHKALLFRTKVRQSKDTKGKTRAFQGIRKSSMEIMKHVRSYRRARKALQHLGADDKILDKYKEIGKADLNMSADTLEENRFGQRNDALAWFWRLGPQSDSDGDRWMEECKLVLM